MQNKIIIRQLLSRHLIAAAHSYFKKDAAGTDEKLCSSSGGEKQQCWSAALEEDR
jgi:hypothetical protein